MSKNKNNNNDNNNSSNSLVSGRWLQTKKLDCLTMLLFSQRRRLFFFFFFYLFSLQNRNEDSLPVLAFSSKVLQSLWSISWNNFSRRRRRCFSHSKVIFGRFALLLLERPNSNEGWSCLRRSVLWRKEFTNLEPGAGSMKPGDDFIRDTLHGNSHCPNEYLIFTKSYSPKAWWGWVGKVGIMAH